MASNYEVARRIGGRTKRYKDFQETEYNQSQGRRERYGNDGNSPTYRRGSGVGHPNAEAGRNDSISEKHGDRATDLSALKQSRRSAGTMTTGNKGTSGLSMRGPKPK